MQRFICVLMFLATGCLMAQRAPMVFDLSAPGVDKLPVGAKWMVSLHTSDGALIQQWPFKATALVQRVTLPPQAMGTYTAAFYLDLNGNGELDKGFFGQPTEPYAFSNQARSMFSKPSIESQRFKFAGQVIAVRLEYHFGG